MCKQLLKSAKCKHHSYSLGVLSMSSGSKPIIMVGSTYTCSLLPTSSGFNRSRSRVTGNSHSCVWGGGAARGMFETRCSYGPRHEAVVLCELRRLEAGGRANKYVLRQGEHIYMYPVQVIKQMA